MFLREKDAHEYAQIIKEYRKHNNGQLPTLDKKHVRFDAVKERGGENDPVELYIAEWSEEEVQDMGVHLVANSFVFCEVNNGKHLVEVKAGILQTEFDLPSLQRRFQQIYDLKL